MASAIDRSSSSLVHSLKAYLRGWNVATMYVVGMHEAITANVNLRHSKREMDHLINLFEIMCLLLGLLMRRRLSSKAATVWHGNRDFLRRMKCHPELNHTAGWQAPPRPRLPRIQQQPDASESAGGLPTLSDSDSRRLQQY